MTDPPLDHARSAYDALAPAYDTLTGGHDHEAWTRTMESCAREAGLSGNRLLDVACGTGNTLLPMLHRGYDVTGVDVSTVMLDEARRKTAGRAELVFGDLRALPELGTFDLVWCLGDALNYLQDRDELSAAFGGLRRSLAPGAVLVFDVNTLVTFRQLYSSILAFPTPDRVVLLEGHGSPQLPSGGRARVTIDHIERASSGWWHRTRSVHHHRHHPPGEVIAVLAEAGLECVAVRGSHTTGALEQPLDDLRHAKAVFTARATE
jgi:SAM-dependent methyltransferase